MNPLVKPPNVEPTIYHTGCHTKPRRVGKDAIRFMSLSITGEQVRRFDRDRFITALFAPVGRREALFGLYAFNQEVARIPELVSEPLLGRIRLQWWHDTLDSLFAGGSVAHPVAAALIPAVRAYRLSRKTFDRFLKTRESDLEPQPPADLAALELYAEGTASTINFLALEILGVEDETAFHAGRHLGIAWALTGLLRAVPFHAAAGRLFLPADLLAAHDVLPEDILAARRRPGLARIGEVIASRARQHLVHARSKRGVIPKAALPALLTAPLAERYLDALGKAGFDLLDPGWSATRPRPALLTWNVLRGRY
jgi:phytoene synthase